MSNNELKDGIFRAYDIRGIYPTDIDEEFAKKVGRAYGTHVGAGKRISVGRDVRTSSESLKENMVEGLLSTGAQITYIGTVPSPLLYFSIAHLNLDGGITISASHNPPEWNGFKICGEKAKVFGFGSGLEKIKEIIKNDEYLAAGRGNIVDRTAEVLAQYENFVLDKVKLGRKLRIGVDPGNGACAEFAARILRKAGMEVIAINDVRDGRFPSRSPEPRPDTIMELRKLVAKEKLDFGVAFDGDGDRAVFVDDLGEVLYGDKVLTIMIKHCMPMNDCAVFEVSCSDAVEESIKEKNGRAILSKVGYSFIREKMRDNSAFIGGEISGHMYFGDVYGIDDAFFASLKMAEILSNNSKKLSELALGVPQYKIHRQDFSVDDKNKFRIIEKITDNMKKTGYRLVTIDGVKVITDDGWFILRASNTTPVIRMSAEARTSKRLEELVKMATDELKG